MSNASNNQLWLPGHPYNRETQTGIEWDTGAGKLRLHARWPIGSASKVVAEAPLPRTSQWDFWYNLRFAEAFPQVAFWWFGDAWTGRVKISGPVAAQGNTLTGFVRFTDDETAGAFWQIEDSDPLVISVPMPENHVNPRNLPLQLSVAVLVFGGLNDVRYTNTWFTLSSLAARDKLAETFPAIRAALRTEVPAVQCLVDLAPGGSPDVDLDGPADRVWRLEEHDMSLREAFCRVLGLQPA